jgi:hypothetical protein
MSNLTNAQVSELNNDDTANRQVGLGTLLRKLASGGFMQIEPIVGKVNTGYAIVDACDAKNMATISDPTIFTNALDPAMFNTGTGSNQLSSISNTITVNQTVLRTIGQVSWAASDTIGMWVFTDTALAAGDVQLVLNDTIGGLQYINLPAINPKTDLQWIEIALGATARTEIVGYGFRRHVAKEYNLHVDGIIRFAIAGSSVLGNVPLVTEFSTYAIQTSSPKLVMAASAAASVNTPSVLTENTDYIVGIDTKRIIFMTDQSANTGFVVYMA